MSYATIDDVFTRYPRIESMVGSGTNDVTSLEVSSSYIADAESYVDAYLGAKYVVPFSSAPTIVRWLTADIAICNMVFEHTKKAPQLINDRWERINSTLDKLRDGKMTLVGGSVTEVSSGDQEVWSTTQDWHPTFSSVLDPTEQRVDRDHSLSDRADRQGDGGSVRVGDWEW